MSGILLHLHFKPDKIIFRVTFFLEGNFKLNIFFLVISLSLTSPTSLSDCKSLTIKREAMIHCCHLSLPGVWRGAALHFQLRSLLKANLSQNLKTSSLPISQKPISALCQRLTVDASFYTPKAGEVRRYIRIWILGLYPLSTNLVSWFALSPSNKGYRLGVRRFWMGNPFGVRQTRRMKPKTFSIWKDSIK